MRRTTQMCGCTGRFCRGGWRCWKFPPTAAEALAEAVDAHLIVFVGHCAQAVPGWLHIWLEEWAAHRHVEEAALAVMGDENTGGFTPAAIP